MCAESPSEKDAQFAELFHFAMRNMESRNPCRIGQSSSRRAAAIRNLLDFGQRHFRQVLSARFRWNVRDHATALRIKGDDREYSFFGSEEMHLVFRNRRFNFRVGEDKTLVVGRAFKIHVEQMACAAMRAITPNQPRRFDCFFAPARVANGCKHRRIGLRETDKFLFALNGNAETLQVLDQNPFRFRLGETEDKRIRTRDGAHIDCGDLVLLIVNAKTTQAQSGGEHLVDYAYCLEDFERAWKNSKRL